MNRLSRPAMLPGRLVRLAGLLAVAVVAASCGRAEQVPATPAPAATTASTTTTKAPAHTPLSVPPISQADLAAWLGSNDAAGALVLVVDAAGEETLTTAGRAAIGTEDRIGPSDTFRIGSVTKLYTAAVVLRLAEEDVLALDDPAADHVPGLPPSVTIEHLLSHTSGIVDPAARPVIETVLDPSLIPDPESQIERAVAGGLRSDPGNRQVYANVNFLILGGVIEAATGRGYGQELDRLVVTPLDLTATGLEPNIEPSVAPHERPGPDQPSLPLADLPTGAVVEATTSAGAIVSTAGDLAEFVRSIFDGSLLSAASVEAMLEVDRGARSAYGLGLSAYPAAGPDVYGHNGRTVGFAASVRHDLVSSTTVIVLSNQGDAPTADLADEVMRTVLAG